MRFDEFEGALKHYQNRVQDDQIYASFAKEIESSWPSSEKDTADVLVRFLIKWGRMGRTGVGNLRTEIALVLLKARAGIEAFRPLYLQTCELEEPIVVGNERLLLQNAVLILFEMFSSIGQGFADVGTTKCLHLLAPGFFVIWDNTTRDKVATRYRSMSWTYTRGFLPIVKRDLEELIADITSRFSVSRPNAVNRIQEFGGVSRSAAKRMDEYYFSVHKYGYQHKAVA